MPLTMSTPLLTVATAAILSTGLVCQDPEPGKGKAGGKVVQEASSKKDTLETWDDKKAKAVLDEFKKAYKARAPEKQKLDALELLRSGKSKKLVKPLVNVVKTERKHESCRILAAELLGNQDNMRKRLLSLINDAKMKRAPAVLAALIRAYSKSSYDSKDWKDFKQLFDQYIADRRFPKVQKAIVQMIGDNKELGGLDLLAAAMEGPQPVWVDDPNNPPASYWEARWKNWEKWRMDAKEALFKISGKQFATNKEAKTWVSKNRKRLYQERMKAEREARKAKKKRR
jgi:hypothetical protein